MTISNWKIGTRLAAGFGLLILLLAALLAVGLLRLNAIADMTDNIIKKGWTKAEAASTINVLIRANARRTMELFIAVDKQEMDKICQRIEGNKKNIVEALNAFEALIQEPDARLLLTKTRQSNALYVASVSKVVKLQQQGNREEAIQKMHGETMAALAVLQNDVKAMMDLQRKQMDAAEMETEHAISATRAMMIGLGLIALLIGIACAWWITRSVTHPLNVAVNVAQTVAAGDLTSRIEVGAQDETGHLLRALKEMNESLARIVGQVRGGAEAIAGASGEIANGNLDLSSRTEQQAGSLEQTATSMEQLTYAVKHNADNVSQANQLVVSASEVALKGGAIVAQVVHTMDSINDSARRIADIIGVIDGIAFQTNILALNAAVEAARAGEQGRGFAVVATEVRSLAQRSAAAAKEIKVLIGDSVEQVDAGARLVNKAGMTMEEIVASVRRVTDIMSEISIASQEQSDGIERINRAIGQMDAVTQQNAALVEQAAAAAESLQDQAASLTQAVGVFKLHDASADARITQPGWPHLTALPVTVAHLAGVLAPPQRRSGMR